MEESIAKKPRFSNLMQDLTTMTSVLDLIDPMVITKLHKHQIQAVEFILKRLLSDKLSGQTNFETGAILADDMGTGKSLVSLVVMHTLTRLLSCKAVLVCPSSLLTNWQNELNKWFPGTLARTATIIHSSSGKGSKALDQLIHSFITSYPLLQPILILSYDMFRVYSQALNTMNNWEILICDEGHRIKNVLGTKTTDVLHYSCAMRRLILTGTPIQNNLSELYTVVQFVLPNYLGSYQEFEEEFERIIQRGNQFKATKEEKLEKGNRMKLLQEKLTPICLRRNKEMILQSMLPQKHDFLLFIPLNSPTISISTAVSSVSPSSSQSLNPQPSTSDKTTQELYQQLCEEMISPESSTTNTTTINKTNKPNQTSKLNNSTKPLLEKNHLFAYLMKLRIFCSSGFISSSSNESLENQSIDTTTFTPTLETASETTTTTLNSHPKLQICYKLIEQIHQQSPCDKVIIVSNFMSTLNQCKLFCKSKQWPVLRIDGSVPMEKRNKIIQIFNKPITLNAEGKPTHSIFILLLSTKAGGIGLNLIGANRLILLDPDWNPATDQQALARIWRPGQTKPVYLYRLILSNTIEESIYFRQTQKNQLQAVIQETKTTTSQHAEPKKDHSYVLDIDSQPSEMLLKEEPENQETKVEEIEKIEEDIEDIQSSDGLTQLVYPHLIDIQLQNKRYQTLHSLTSLEIQTIDPIFVSQQSQSLLTSSSISFYQPK